MSAYQDFLDRKAQLGQMSGFEPISLPSFLFDFQQALVDWALRKGRVPRSMPIAGSARRSTHLVWADNVVLQRLNRPALILTPPRSIASDDQRG